ncbi:MAG TPA: DUF1360 domain-containing protein [Mycobacteriales bacterium]|nr:DUF1360 domain-containing protein [Mycobacteriales bacterium]
MTAHAANPAERLTAKVRSEVRSDVAQYEHGEERPLKGYLALLGTYGSLVGTLAATIRWRRAPLPERIPPYDLALISVATHKVARVIAKDPVTSPFRAPFTRYEGQQGPAELQEQVRGHGFRHAAGELLTCPFCLGQWVATVFAGGYVLAPRLTRLVAATFTAVAAGDALHHAYAAIQPDDEG